jgi:hypothetical protein
MKTVTTALIEALEFLDETPETTEMIEFSLIEDDTVERSVFKLQWENEATFKFEVLVSVKTNNAAACVLHRRKFKRVRMNRIMNTLMNALNNDPLDMPALDDGKYIPSDED